MLNKLLRETNAGERPTHLAVIFDKSSKTFRNRIYPDYKAHRPPPPEDLVPQFGLIKQATEAFNVPAVEQDDFEADDLIATYAVQARAAGATVRIVSSDKDLMQLVGDGVVLYDTMKDREVGEPEVLAKFGVTPDKVIEVQALAGDSVDNIPGVPGIGVKTGAQLIEEYGDLDTLLARAGEIKQPKRRQNLIEFADQARISKELVTVRQDVPVEVPLDDFAVRAPDAEGTDRLPQGPGVHHADPPHRLGNRCRGRRDRRRRHHREALEPAGTRARTHSRGRWRCRRPGRRRPCPRHRAR